MDVPIDAIRRCAGDPAFLDAMVDFYRRLDTAIAERQPVCVNRGGCCHFDAFGHRLFVTSAELAYFVASEEMVREAAPDGPCPYQIGGRCTARGHRPAGCRVFFCDPRSAVWQGPLTERALGELKVLHARHDLPYCYLEWRTALRALASPR
jgi:hypothetical protein